MTTETTPAWLSAKQVAARYGVTVSTVWRWNSEQQGFPHPRRLSGNCTRWDLNELQQWERARELVS